MFKACSGPISSLLSLLLLSQAPAAEPAAKPKPASKPAAAAPAKAAPQSDEDGVEIVTGNEREPAVMQAARERVGPLENLNLPADRLKRLPKSMARLREGKSLRIVMLGDSIINDTARSAWHELVAASYPGSTITRTAVVRATTGCWYYKEPGRIEKYVLAYKPHLVIIGGISQRNDLKSIVDCLTQIRSAYKCELFLMTGPYGAANPLAGPDWRKRLAQDERYAAGLRAVADSFGAEFLDLQWVWGQTVRSSGKPLEFFKRDPIHASPEGEAVLAKILEQYFAPQK